MDKQVLIVFLKVPEKGRVKTRLSKLLDETLVLKLYKGFVRDLMKLVDMFPHCIVCFWPPESENGLKVFLGKDYDLCPQHGADLGEKMANAFGDVFESGADSSVLVGSDIPELTQQTIQEAFRCLEKSDAVLGPTPDGGYYLVGFTRKAFRKDVFNGVKWSSPSALDDTMKSFNRNGLSCSLAPRLHDIDTPEDLEELAERVAASNRVGEHTRRFLNRQ